MQNDNLKKPPRREACLLLHLLPEVGGGLRDKPFFHPTVDDGFHYRRLVVGQTEADQVLLRKLLGECIQVAEVALRGLRADGAIVESVNLVAIELQLVVQAALGIPEGKADGALRLLMTFQQIGDDAGSEAVEGSTTTSWSRWPPRSWVSACASGSAVASSAPTSPASRA